MPPKTAAKKGGKSAKPKVAPPKPPTPKRVGKKEIEEVAASLKKTGKINNWTADTIDSEFNKRVNAEEKLPAPYLLPNVIYEIDHPDNLYFKLLTENDITLPKFILLLHKVDWIFPRDDSPEKKIAYHLKTLIDAFVNSFKIENINTFFQRDVYDLDSDRFECDAITILNYFGNYKILGGVKAGPEEKFPLPSKLIQIINRAKDADFAQILDAFKIAYPKPQKEDLLFFQPVIKKVEGKGYGLFAMREYKPGECVALYEGRFTSDENPSDEESRYFASLTTKEEDEKEKNNYFIDGTYGWTLKSRGRWVNHASDYGTDNCEFYVITSEGPVNETIASRVLTIAAKRHIKIGDEFLVNYGDKHPFELGMEKPDPEKYVPAFFETYNIDGHANLDPIQNNSALSKAAELEGVSLYFDKEKGAYVIYDPI